MLANHVRKGEGVGGVGDRSGECCEHGDECDPANVAETQRAPRR